MSSIDLQSLDDLRGLGFPGMSPADCPFQVVDGVSMVEALHETKLLLWSAIETLTMLIPKMDEESSDCVVRGAVFMLNAASAFTESAEQTMTEAVRSAQSAHEKKQSKST